MKTERYIPWVKASWYSPLVTLRNALKAAGLRCQRHYCELWVHHEDWSEATRVLHILRVAGAPATYEIEALARKEGR